jgi:hypothetical protein
MTTFDALCLLERQQQERRNQHWPAPFRRHSRGHLIAAVLAKVSGWVEDATCEEELNEALGHGCRLTFGAGLIGIEDLIAAAVELRRGVADELESLRQIKSN